MGNVKTVFESAMVGAGILRSMLSYMTWKGLLQAVAEEFPVQIITSEGDPYLYKYLLWRSDPGRDSWRVHLHRFVRHDIDKDPHDHPWTWAVALILAGGYVEETPDVWEHDEGQQYAHRRRGPGSLRYFRGDFVHRIDSLLDGDSWTLFVSGPVTRKWGFYDREHLRFTYWREYLGVTD